MKQPVQLLLSLSLVMVGCAAIAASTAETPGERFRGIMEEMAKRCVEKKLKPTDSRCSLPKLKPADPLATPEGRFAHSIKIPNPVPEDSGYRPGMTPQEYFDHFCKTEAGEFIYKTVDNVEGIYQMRPREHATDDMQKHLYALEDPYGHLNSHVFKTGTEALEAGTIQSGFVNPRYSDYVPFKSKQGYELYKPDQNYKFLEKPIPKHMQSPADGAKYLRYTRPNTDKLVVEDGQYFYHQKDEPKLVEERVAQLKSRYGFTWRGIERSSRDREFGIAGGELIVLDLQTNEIMAIRRGFIRSGNVPNSPTGIWWLNAQACPAHPVWATKEFLHKVLKSSREVK